MNQRDRLQVFPWLLLLSASSLAQPQQPAAQVPPSVRLGMMSTVPVGVVVQSSITSELLIAEPGQGGAAPSPWSVARFGASGQQRPEYTLASIFGSQASLVTLTAVSTGNDYIPVIEGDGRLNMALGPVWFGLTVSVTNDSWGEAGGHVERVRNGGLDSPGAELFTHYADGGAGLDPSLWNTTVAERSRESLGFSSNPVAAPPDREDVQALDFGLGIIPFDPDDRSGIMFSVRDRIFFALRDDCVDLLGNDFAIDYSLPFVAGLPQTVPANAATIYMSVWQESTPGVFDWTQPEVYRSPAQLELVEGVDQVDAIAVDYVGSREIYSTQPSPGRSQLQVRQLTPYVSPRTLLDPNGADFSEQVGVTESSDVDGTCGIDPELSANFSGVLGIPELAYTPSGSEPLGVSLSRSRSGPSGLDRIDVHVTGRGAGSAGGVVTLYVADRQKALSGGPLDLGSAWTAVDTQAVTAGQIGVSWSFPAPAVSMDLAVCAYHWSPGGNPDVLVPVRGSWVSMLEL